MRRRSLTPSRTHGPLRCASQQRLQPTHPRPPRQSPKLGTNPPPPPGPRQLPPGQKDSAGPGVGRPTWPGSACRPTGRRQPAANFGTSNRRRQKARLVHDWEGRTASRSYGRRRRSGALPGARRLANRPGSCLPGMPYAKLRSGPASCTVVHPHGGPGKPTCQAALARRAGEVVSRGTSSGRTTPVQDQPALCRATERCAGSRRAHAGPPRHPGRSGNGPASAAQGRRRRKRVSRAVARSSSRRATHSAVVCAWAMSPGPNTTLGMPAALRIAASQK